MSTELADAAVTALVDLDSIEALATLIDCDGIDPVMLRGAIDEKASLLERALGSAPTPFVVETTTHAMSIYPIQDLADPLMKAARSTGDTMLVANAADVARIMRASGVPVNPKSGRG